MRSRPVAVGAALIATSVVCLAAAGGQARPASRPAPAPHAGFAVEAAVDGFWQPAGDLPFGPAYREATLPLPDAALAAPVARVRLVPHGGGASHVDRVALGSAPPASLSGGREAGALGLVLRRDDDVLDATGRTVELAFPSPRAGSLLRLTARVEPERIPASPFAFPVANQYRAVTPASAFYSFRPSPSADAPDWPEALRPEGALFAERCAPATGHPSGVTYGWVANDRDTLYAAVEFTPDNTRDGDSDWASLMVVAGGEVREFRVSERETRWGRPLFLATPRASYRHKLYLFEVPFARLGAKDAGATGEVKLAFSAYGTAAPSWLLPPFHDFGLVGVASTSPGATFTISNSSGSTMLLGTPWYTRSGPDSASFPLAPGTCGSGLSLPPGGSCVFSVSFAPTGAGAAADDLLFSASFGGAPSSAPLRVVGSGFASGVPALGALGLGALVLVLAGAGIWLLRRG